MLDDISLLDWYDGFGSFGAHRPVALLGVRGGSPYCTSSCLSGKEETAGVCVEGYGWADTDKGQKINVSRPVTNTDRGETDSVVSRLAMTSRWKW